MIAGAATRTRPATLDDLAACERIWRDALDDYFPSLGVPPLPPENPTVGRLHRHTLATDPDLFRVAVRSAARGQDVTIGFASAIRRAHVWFLSMLFVDPVAQGRGVGRSLLDAILPPRSEGDGVVLATATDAAQPISNALYARLGMVPRMPLLSIVGRPRADADLPPLPGGITGLRVTHAEADARDGGPRPLDPSMTAAIAALDTAVLGYAHPEDHAYVRGERRSLFVYRDGGGRLIGYGYASEIGRIGPIAVEDPALLAPVLGDLLRSVVPRGASAVWLPGDAGPAVTAALRAGLRLEGFPVLIAASAPFADFSRYVPIGPGLP